MRGACLTVAILLSCSISFSLQSNSSAATVGTPASSAAINTPTTLSGCLMNMNGAFFLTTANGERFILKGKHNSMFSHNGQQVEITVKPDTGSSPHASPRPLTVTHIEMVAQVCR